MGSPGILCSSGGEFLAFRTGIPGGPDGRGPTVAYVRQNGVNTARNLGTGG